MSNLQGLQDLLDAVQACDAAQDFDGLRTLRQQIVELHPHTDAAVEAMYKLGIDALFRERDLSLASERFSLAAAESAHPFWAAAARTSLGLCLFHQKRTQKALFELRKVAYSKTASSHSVTALAFMENILASTGEVAQAQRARMDRIEQLEAIIVQQRAQKMPLNDIAFYQYQLGLALRELGERERARTLLTDAKNVGPQVLGPELYQTICEALTAVS